MKTSFFAILFILFHSNFGFAECMVDPYHHTTTCGAGACAYDDYHHVVQCSQMPYGGCAYDDYHHQITCQ